MYKRQVPAPGTRSWRPQRTFRKNPRDGKTGCSRDIPFSSPGNGSSLVIIVPLSYLLSLCSHEVKAPGLIQRHVHDLSDQGSVSLEVDHRVVGKTAGNIARFMGCLLYTSVEKMMRDDLFVANDTYLDNGKNRICLLYTSGPGPYDKEYHRGQYLQGKRQEYLRPAFKAGNCAGGQ